MRLFDPKRLIAVVLGCLAGILVIAGMVLSLGFLDALLQLAQIMLAVALLIGVLNVIVRAIARSADTYARDRLSARARYRGDGGVCARTGRAADRR